MAYKNLKAEMGREDISIEAVAECLKLHRNSISNKINGPSSFSIEEAVKIRDKFFPKLELDYLFASEETGKENN